MQNISFVLQVEAKTGLGVFIEVLLKETTNTI